MLSVPTLGSMSVEAVQQMAPWISAIPSSQLYARETWEVLNSTLKGELFFSRAQDILGVTCPKVGIGFFWYPTLQAHLRGAKALAPIAKGETLCEVPVRSMFSEFTVSNSSLRPISAALDTAADVEAKGGRKRRRALDQRALMALLVLREAACERSPLMPYVRALLEPAVRAEAAAIPATWADDSPRLAELSPSGAPARAAPRRPHAPSRWAPPGAPRWAVERGGSHGGTLLLAGT